jgi:ABC-type glycerol-3-phosphate transport system permease component
VIITAGGAGLGVILTAMMGYGLCNSIIRGVKPVSYLYHVHHDVSGGRSRPSYLVKNWGWMNNLLAVILPRP